MDTLNTVLTILRDPLWTLVIEAATLLIAILSLAVKPPKKKLAEYGVVFLIAFLIFITVFALYAENQLSSDPYKLYKQVASRDALYDPLNGPNGNNWDVSKAMSCGFKNGAYHASATQPGVITECLAESIITNANFGYQVQMTVLGGDGGGLIFGALGTNASKYRFFVGTGTYYDLFVSVENKQLCSDTTGVIHAGFNQSNTLTVIVVSTTIYLYINGMFVKTCNTLGNSPISGKIGVFADEFNVSHAKPSPADVIFSNAKVWEL